MGVSLASVFDKVDSRIGGIASFRLFCIPHILDNPTERPVLSSFTVMNIDFENLRFSPSCRE